MPNNKYREYFDIDEEYFPQVNDSTIAAASSDFWMRTYPHYTFIDMLNNIERVLARQEKRSVWIEGVYGTGKSLCAYALKKILDVPEKELRTYWDKYEPLKKKTDLLEKIIGHKQKGIITAHRYASGMINSPRDLFLAIQNTLKDALIAANLYTGENTLKESVIAWIEKPANKRWLDELLSQPEYSSSFSQSTADDVLNTLHGGGDVKMLMDNIFRLADKEGVVTLNIDADKLIAWINDIIDRNDIRIVFIWDEFSDYIMNNRESLSEFQKLVELVNLKPFYFISVTHQMSQLFPTQDSTWNKIRDRFIPVEIRLPDNIAFELIGHAFNIKPAAKADWDKLVDGDLGSQTTASRAAVMKAVKIDNPQVMKDIMPIHPMAAYLLSNIASSFKSNQRSMFDFIKSSSTDDEKAFQWFIDNKGPFDEHPLLTVDMLWDFFYEKGKENLTPNIRIILDTFQRQQNLRDEEKTVLKAILIMQAIDVRTGSDRSGIELFKATEQNLSYVFEGISSGLDVQCKNIAKQLKERHILVTSKDNEGRLYYTIAVTDGGDTEIEKIKKEIREKTKTAGLVIDGGLSTVLSLHPALSLRYEAEQNTGKITPVTTVDFQRQINILRDCSAKWNFHAVIAFAKDDKETISLRNMIKTAIADEQYKNIIFIDALSTPLGTEAFEDYIGFSARAIYHQGSNNMSSRENADKARRVLNQNWSNRIYNGQFIIYSYDNPEGEKYNNVQGVQSALQARVTTRFPNVFDFNNLSGPLFKLTNATAVAKCAIYEEKTSGVVVGLEKNILPAVWKVEKYWENPATLSLQISMIKREVDEKVSNAFSRDGGGQISIGEIYDFLEEKFGFAPCNLSAFLTGFLLKEYAKEPYRYSDSSGGHESMSPDKLAEMIGNYIGKKPKPTYIVRMTADEMTFYDLTEKAWHIAPNSCSSPDKAAHAVQEKMRALGLPVWCLEEVDENGIFDIVQKYSELVQKEGKEAHKAAVEIGKIASAKPTLSLKLSSLLTSENCQKGMREFLHSFEDGMVLEISKEIGAEGNLIKDIRRVFEVKHSCLWDKQTGEEAIRRLLVEYGIVKVSNSILKTNAHSLQEVYKEWREQLKFIGISNEALKAKYPSLSKFFDIMMKIYKHEEILPEQLKILLNELNEHSQDVSDILDNDKKAFSEIYEPYLEDLNATDIGEVKSKLPTGMYELTKTDCNLRVKESVVEYRKNQLKSQLFSLWKDKTGTKNPHEWSSRYRTPILCCVSESEYEEAKKAFSTLNRSWGTDAEIKFAYTFLENAKFFEDLEDDNKRNLSFVRDILGKYKALLSDISKVRDQLDKLSIDTYDWRDHPGVSGKIKQLAEAEYNAGGSDKAQSVVDGVIDNMDSEQMRQFLKELVRENMTIGIEIITRLGE
jgi:hypothetical protein